MSITKKRGSIALARSLCYQINGAADDSDDISAGGGYGSVDIAEILSAEVVRLQEALKLALDALENHTAIKHPQQIHYRDKAITAIKEALAQPEQEPFGYFKAEPFGWTDCAESDVGAIALYQTPPRRTWVGLTDEEISELIRATHNTGSFVRAIEAKLKQKNGYTEEKNT